MRARNIVVATMLAVLGACHDVQSPPPTLPPSGETLEQGVAYEGKLYIHCGMEWLGPYNGSNWMAPDAPPYSTGGGREPPPDWPVEQQEVAGVVTLVAEDLIHFEIDGTEVVVEYRPTDDVPPGCS